jgi:hypothetical protein
MLHDNDLGLSTNTLHQETKRCWGILFESIFFKTWSCYFAKDGLKLPDSTDPPTLPSQVAKTTFLAQINKKQLTKPISMFEPYMYPDSNNNNKLVNINKTIKKI